MKKWMLLLCLLSACSKYSLSVKREDVDRGSLASTYVQSPDPRQKDPPTGQRLVVQWRVPNTALDEEMCVALSVIYRNYKQETVYYPIDKERGMIIFSILDEKHRDTEGLMTYKAEILTLDGEVLDEWKQQLWVELIPLDLEDPQAF